MNLYEQILAGRWNEVDLKVRNSHLTGSVLRAECRLDVEDGANVFGKIARRIVLLPAPVRDAPVELVIREAPGGELWERKFPDNTLSSVQYRSPDSCLVDRFGIIAFHFRLTVSEGSIHHIHRRTYLHLGSIVFRLPLWLSPTVVSHESADAVENASRINVSLSLPLVGRVLAYAGIVQPVRTAP
jgi:hypothetical protein